MAPVPPIIRAGPVPVPMDYEVPVGAEIVPVSVSATFSDPGSVGQYVPALEVLTPDGHVLGPFPLEQTIAAGASARVSWFPGVKRSSGGGGSGGSVVLSVTTYDFGVNTWTLPALCDTVEVYAIGGGGGGGGGGSGSGAGNGSGAGGGGGGCVNKAEFRAADVPSSVTVTVGSGGAGGTPGAAGVNTNGVDGGASSFGSLLLAGGGGGGIRAAVGGGSSGGAGGASTGSAVGPTPADYSGQGSSGAGTAKGTQAANNAGIANGFPAENGGASGGGCGVGALAGSAGGSAVAGGPGGGAGGGISSTTGAAGGQGGSVRDYSSGGGGTGGSGGGATTAGAAGIAFAGPYCGTAGGGGGSGNTGINGAVGGAGGIGAGGGGGGSSANGAGASGGAGGHGRVVVVAYGATSSGGSSGISVTDGVTTITNAAEIDFTSGVVVSGGGGIARVALNPLPTPTFVAAAVVASSGNGSFTWATVDVSGTVPAGATWVFLFVIVQGLISANAAYHTNQVDFRKDSGSQRAASVMWGGAASSPATNIDGEVGNMVMVPITVARKFDWQKTDGLNNSSGATVTLLGYW